MQTVNLFGDLETISLHTFDSSLIQSVSQEVAFRFCLQDGSINMRHLCFKFAANTNAINKKFCVFY